MTPEMRAHLAALAAWNALGEEGQAAYFAAEHARRSGDDIGYRLAMAAELCECSGGGCGCGGGPPRICSRPGRPIEVTAEGCRECKAREWWEAGAG